MRTLRELAVALLFLAVLATTPGCLLVAVAAGATGAAYVSGDLEAKLEADPPHVVKAATSALQELEVELQGEPDATAVDGHVVGRTALQKKVDIAVKRESETTSKIWIRINTFGDEDLSRQILEKIRSKL